MATSVDISTTATTRVTPRSVSMGTAAVVRDARGDLVGGSVPVGVHPRLRLTVSPVTELLTMPTTTVAFATVSRRTGYRMVSIYSTITVKQTFSTQRTTGEEGYRLATILDTCGHAEAVDGAVFATRRVAERLIATVAHPKGSTGARCLHMCASVPTP